VAVGGGDWNVGATWGSASFPVAGDTAIIAATSGALRIPTGVPAACSTFTIQKASTTTFDANLTVSGVVTFTGADILAGIATLFIGGGITVGLKGSVSAASTATINLNGNQTVPSFSFGADLIMSAGVISWGNNTNSFSGIVKYTGGTMSFNPAHIASFASGSSIDTAEMTWNTVTFSGAITFLDTFNAVKADWIQPTTFSGAFDWNVAIFRSAGTATLTQISNAASSLVSGITINVTDSIYIAGNYPYSTEIKSTTPGTQFTINFTGGVADCYIHNAILTDVKVTGTNLRGVFIERNNCRGVNQIRNSDMLAAGATLCLLN